jgi:pimeloyl-ACP methyl ester carboxylesterase
MNMSEAATAQPRSRHRLGMLGTVLGVAAAGLAAGIAAERTLVRRIRNDPADPYAREPFGRLPFDDSLMVPTSDGASLYVEVVEPADGVELDAAFAARVASTSPSPEPTLVFVHGFCLDMGTFHFQRKEVTRGGDWRAVYYDQPGHGRSEALPTGDYELPALGDALRAVLDATAPAGPVVLVGHSMGGMVIMAFAERYPELFADRVAGAVLISTSAGKLEGVALGIPELLARAGKPLLPLVTSATRLGGGVIDRARLASSDLAWLLTRRYGFGAQRPSPALVSYVEHMNSRTSIETVTRYLRTLYSHARYPALEVLRDKPVLLICGDCDPITPLAHSDAIKSHLPDAELVVVPDSGHVVMMEHPDDVNAALLSFLEKIE